MYYYTSINASLMRKPYFWKCELEIKVLSCFCSIFLIAIVAKVGDNQSWSLDTQQRGWMLW